jgi:transcriptional regulator with PAS, ATPase and Fis domain
LFNARQTRPTPITGIDEAALRAMCQFRWPGNVRELSNAIEGAFTFSRSPVIRLEDLPRSVTGGEAAGGTNSDQRFSIGTFADSERVIIQRALESTGGNKVQAAKLLKISRKKLYAKITKYALR